MMDQAKPEALLSEKLAFISSVTIGTVFVGRNFARMRKYLQSYGQLRDLMGRNCIVDVTNVIGGQKERCLLLLETVAPNFQLNYFKNIEDSSKYTKRVGNFYEGLVFDSGFEGKIRTFGKEYQIWFQMDKPIVGREVPLGSRQFDKRGIKFHRQQLISVLGELRYSKQMKKGVMKTRMLCLDRIEMQKYWQMKIIATILSTFYFGIMLGVAISIYAHRNITELQQMKAYIEEFTTTSASQLKEIIAAYQHQNTNSR